MQDIKVTFNFENIRTIYYIKEHHKNITQLGVLLTFAINFSNSYIGLIRTECNSGSKILDFRETVSFQMLISQSKVIKQRVKKLYSYHLYLCHQLHPVPLHFHHIQIPFHSFFFFCSFSPVYLARFLLDKTEHNLSLF